MSIKHWLAAVAVSMCLVAPPAAAQVFSWDPLKDVQEALPEGVPSEAKILQARQQVRKWHRTRLLRFTRSRPAPAAIDRALGRLRRIQHVRGQALLRRRHHRQGHGRQPPDRSPHVHEDAAGPGRTRLRPHQESAHLRLHLRTALRNFISQGWEFGAQANLSAMARGQGAQFTGAAVESPGVYLYQLTRPASRRRSLLAGTKFFKDGDLN